MGENWRRIGSLQKFVMVDVDVVLAFVHIVQKLEERRKPHLVHLVEDSYFLLVFLDLRVLDYHLK